MSPGCSTHGSRMVRERSEDGPSDSPVIVLAERLANHAQAKKKPAERRRTGTFPWDRSGWPRTCFRRSLASTSTTPASCTSDFAVFALNSTGSATQANLVAYENLYSGTGPGLCGLAPTVKFAYRINKGLIDGNGGQGALSVSPVLSLTGDKVAFVESDVTGTNHETYLHILKWKNGDGSVGAPVTPTQATDITTCTAPCIVSLLLDAVTNNEQRRRHQFLALLRLQHRHAVCRQ